MYRTTTLKVPANKFDDWKTQLNAFRPNTIGEPVPFTNNENAPATHYLVDLPADPELFETLRETKGTHNVKLWVRRNPPRDASGEPTELTGRTMHEIARGDGLKPIQQETI